MRFQETATMESLQVVVDSDLELAWQKSLRHSRFRPRFNIQSERSVFLQLVQFVLGAKTFKRQAECLPFLVLDAELLDFVFGVRLNWVWPDFHFRSPA